jgi:hypothetical protein
VFVSLVAALLVGGMVLGLYRHEHGSGRIAGESGTALDGGQDRLAMSSGARDIESAKGHVQPQAASQNDAASRTLQAELAAKQQQQEVEAQQAAQAVELAERNRELEQKAAEQEARERQLQQDRQRLEAEKQKAEAVAAEAERLKQSALDRQSHPTVYSGPSSGDLIWRGEVKGATLVTINGNVSDSGEVVSGALPGVLVMIQPADAKHVGVAGTPAPSNAFHRLTLRIQGNGVVQEVIHWSIP